MNQDSPRNGDGLADNSAPRHRVEQQDKPRGGRRGRGLRATVRQIQTKATERQAAWLQTEQPNLTEHLTRELDGLYGDRRDLQAGTLTAPYRGRTWGPR